MRSGAAPSARARDPSLKLFAELLDNGFDVLSALRRDRSMANEQRFYVGWHFIEDHHPLGEELLTELVKKGGRTKLAKMAKNKLKLTAEA